MQKTNRKTTQWSTSLQHMQMLGLRDFYQPKQATDTILHVVSRRYLQEDRTLQTFNVPDTPEVRAWLRTGYLKGF